MSVDHPDLLIVFAVLLRHDDVKHGRLTAPVLAELPTASSPFPSMTLCQKSQMLW
jgi:hypothetical protein